MYQEKISTYSIEEITLFSKSELSLLAVKISEKHCQHIESTPVVDLHEYSDAAHEYGVVVQVGKNGSLDSKLMRLKSRDYWYERLLALSARAREELAVKSQILGSKSLGKQEYCSDKSYFLAKNTQKLSSKKAAIAGNQNYLTVLGYSEIAFENSFDSILITLTCPPEYHSSSESYSGKTFCEAHDWLNKAYQYIFGYISKKARTGVDYWGIRCTEVHKDGCPHWHILIYSDVKVSALISERISKFYSKQSESLRDFYEKNKSKIFSVRKPLDHGRYKEGISYVFKNAYADRNNKLESLNSERQRIAISCAGKRQHQLIGISGVTKVKELRRRLKKGESIGGTAQNLIVHKQAENRNQVQLNALKDILKTKFNGYVFEKNERTNRYGEKTISVSSVSYTQAQNKGEPSTCSTESTTRLCSIRVKSNYTRSRGYEIQITYGNTYWEFSRSKLYQNIDQKLRI